MAISKHPKLKGAAKTFLSRAQFAVNCDHTCLCDAVVLCAGPRYTGSLLAVFVEQWPSIELS